MPQSNQSKDSSWQQLLPQVARVLGRLEAWLERQTPDSDADPDAPAYRWRDGVLEPVLHPDVYPLDGLLNVEKSVARLRENARTFVEGRPYLDVLLYGERGTGKSSAIRGLRGEFGTKGLRLIEVQREDLTHLSRIYAVLRDRPERFALFCDDLSFEADDASYKALKAELDGGIEQRPPNVMLLATSNRRHLLPEYQRENQEATISDEGELRPGETAEEKLSLSDRFGLLLPFFSFDQDQYLRIVDYHATELELKSRISAEELRARSLRFALERASRSGRTARQACIAILQDLESER